MQRQIGWTLAALVTLALAVDTVQAGAHKRQSGDQQQQQRDRRDDKPQPGHGRFMWWKDAQAKTEVGITDEQTAEIDRIFMPYIEKGRMLREQLNSLEKTLDQTLLAKTAEPSVVAQQVDKVENLRAELNKLRVVTLYRVSRVLTFEQNAKLKLLFERRDAARKKDGDRRK